MTAKAREALSKADLLYHGNINETYEAKIQYISEDQSLTQEERDHAILNILLKHDIYNTMWLKKQINKPCKKCGKIGYTILVCEHCVRKYLEDQFEKWTSGNATIDEAIRTSQIKLPLPRWIVEWIPFEDLENIREIGKGGSSTIYSATWVKGVINDFDAEKSEFKRGQPEEVVLKQIKDSDSPDKGFLQELKVHLSLRSNGYRVLSVWGVTKDPKTVNFVLVLKKMEFDLRSYLKKTNFNTWVEIYHLFWFVAEDFKNMHKDGIFHRDFHSRNLLRQEDGYWWLADFGLSGPANKPSGKIYGNMPYMAPEVLCGRPYESASDIYSIGMVMYECATGHPPFHDREPDNRLALDIVYGKRPTICSTHKVPISFKSKIEECWDAFPEKRPTAEQLSTYFEDLWRKESEKPKPDDYLPMIQKILRKIDKDYQSSLYPPIATTAPRNATKAEQKEYEREHSCNNAPLKEQSKSQEDTSSAPIEELSETIIVSSSGPVAKIENQKMTNEPTRRRTKRRFLRKAEKKSERDSQGKMDFIFIIFFLHFLIVLLNTEKSPKRSFVHIFFSKIFGFCRYS